MPGSNFVNYFWDTKLDRALKMSHDALTMNFGIMRQWVLPAGYFWGTCSTKSLAMSKISLRLASPPFL